MRYLKKWYLALLVLFVVLVAGYFYFTGSSREELRVFHAGSLTLMLEDVEGVYEREFRVDVLRISGGSVAIARKISDVGKRADVVLVADYKVIEKYLYDEYADWTIVFAGNEVVLCYTDKSRYSDEINSENWYEILLRDYVRYGFSNPNIDPCGYRSFAIMYLASKYYGRDDVWSKLVVGQIPNVEVVSNSSGDYLFFPASPEYDSGGRLVLRDKSVDLVQLVEAGIVDYVFEYRNVAEEHGLKYVSLPSEFNLIDDPFIRVFVVLYHGDVERKRCVGISRIRYGLTIPKNCVNCEGAVRFVKWLLYGEGKNYIVEHGFVPVEYEFLGPVPDELRGRG